MNLNDMELEKIVKHFSTGSHAEASQAYHQIYERFSVGISNIAHRYLQTDELMEKYVMEVFSTLWIQREYSNDAASFEKQLFAIAKDVLFREFENLLKERLRDSD